MRTMANRLDGLGNSIFTEMSILAKQTGAVNLGQGFPDTDGPESMLRTAQEAIAHGANQYPPGRGMPELTRSIAEHQRRRYGIDLDPDTQVLVTVGATEAITAAMLALVEPGDEVIAIEPFYDSYVAAIQMAGGVRVPVTLRKPDFALNLDELRAAISARTRVILINTPHNPTGAVFGHDELRGIADVAREHDLIVISDEVYEHLTYGVPHVPISTLEGMAERTLTCSSAGKTFSCTGWKVGWATGPTALVTAVATAKQFVTFTAGGPFQLAVAGALALPDSYFDEFRAGMQRQRDLLVDGLQAAGLTVYEPSGTYFVNTDISGLGYADGMEFCRALPERCGVVAIPCQVFYNDNPDAGRTLVRWAFCKRESVIAEGMAKLAAGLKV